MNRANGLVGQVVRMLDRRGLYQPLAGKSGPPQPIPAFFFGAVPMDLQVLDDNPFYLLPVPQTHIERVLAGRAAELGVGVRRGHELTGLSHNADTVTVEVTRKLAGIGFPGAASDELVCRLAEVAVPDEFVDPATGGLNLPGYGYISPMTLEELHDSIHRVMGAGLPLRPPDGRGPHRLDRWIGVKPAWPTGIATAGCCWSAMLPTCTS